MLLEIPHLLTPEEVEALRAVAARGQFVDGRETAGAALSEIKQNEQLKAAPEQMQVMVEVLQRAMERSAEIQRFAWPRKVRPPILSRYAPGMAYGSHYDQPVMGSRNPMRSDMSMTVFLSETESYDGGELNLVTPFGPRLVKLAPGGAAIYATVLRHQVNPVTRGERLAVVTWIQSLVKDPEKRQILYDIACARQALRELAPDGGRGVVGDQPRDQRDTAEDLLHKTEFNLLRLWAEV